MTLWGAAKWLKNILYGDGRTCVVTSSPGYRTFAFTTSRLAPRAGMGFLGRSISGFYPSYHIVPVSNIRATPYVSTNFFRQKWHVSEGHKAADKNVSLHLALLPHSPSTSEGLSLNYGHCQAHGGLPAGQIAYRWSLDGRRLPATSLPVIFSR